MEFHVPLAGQMPPRRHTAARILMFVYAVVLLAPFRHWAVWGSGESWIFGLNYGAVHGLTVGHDLVWTMGPLSYLTFPQNIGSNLVHGVIFQAGVWVVLAAVAYDLFFRSRIPVVNLALFCALLALSEPLFWFNRLGIENLLLAGALILMILYRWRGEIIRYIGALILIGLIPLIKLTGGMLAASALAGILIGRALWDRDKILRELWLALSIPLIVAGSTAFLLTHSVKYFSQIRVLAFADIVTGYSYAMSMAGPRRDFAAAIVLLGLFAVTLYWQAKDDRHASWYSMLILIPPIAVSLKHGFVRQDEHVVNFLCFVTLAMGLVLLSSTFRGSMVFVVAMAAIVVGLIVWRLWGSQFASMVTGIQPAVFAARSLCLPCLRHRLDTESLQSLREVAAKLEPELRAVVGQAPIASLSIGYSYAFFDDLNLMLYPVIETYSAYTPRLDRLNADWIAGRGPRYLIFDGQTIDGRNAWAQTPSMWTEVYRWYRTRAVGSRNLLLERRTSPRFELWRPAGRQRVFLNQGISIDAALSNVFWSLQCGSTFTGSLRKIFWRSPAVLMSVTEAEGASYTSRVFPELLGSPVVGTLLPDNLAEMAALFGERDPGYSVTHIGFSGPGLTSFGQSCDVQFLQPVMQ